MLEISKKFPKIQSAINIRYDPNLIKKLEKKGARVLFYDRKKEPSKIKQKEYSTISWGIKKSIKNAKNPPDVVFHKGDWGKEPMILVFGQNPEEVISKISQILKA